MNTTPDIRKINREKNRKARIRMLLATGQVEEAGRKCLAWKLDLESCRLSPDEPTTEQKAQEQEERLLSKWPAIADLVVEVQPRNPRLVLARLGDHRQVHLWKGRHFYPKGCLVKAKLVEVIGGNIAYYQPVVI